MSETSIERSDRQVDRPDEVTDPLLWKLALDVADAHEPDGNGGCRNLLCARLAWPCPPWQNAQRALRMARAEPGHAAGPEQSRTDPPTAVLPRHTRPAPRTASAA
ncbi:hypothetical protein [Micromonospora sp. KLBMP9576]|uniref:hypothetical protein n=1 Tax=Micromonospora sp. KLBMP9576 TaxID=3424769 RepID=UPI003D9406D2